MFNHKNLSENTFLDMMMFPMSLIKKNSCLKLSSVVVVFYLLCQSSSGQIIIYTSPTSPVKSNTYHESNLLSLGVSSNKEGRTLVVKPIYLYDEWESAEINFLKDNTVIGDLDVKLNLSENFIEIRLNDEVKILPQNQVYSLIFTGKGDTIITDKKLKAENLTGFFKILYNNKASLLCYYKQEILPANYNVTMAVGRKNDEIIIKKEYYMFSNGKLIKIDENRKKFIEQLNLNQEQVSYLKDEKISTKHESDLIKFMRFYETSM
jgi:hypothetical protein